MAADELDRFLELSALLTGLDELVRRAGRGRVRAMGEEYLRRLRGAFGDRVDRVLAVFMELRGAGSWSDIDHVKLLSELLANPVFTEFEVVARQTSSLWYLSQYRIDEASEGWLDGGFFDRGFVWNAIHTHPIGFSDQPHGYWTRDPRPDASPIGEIVWSRP